jgi:hypothetical protein
MRHGNRLHTFHVLKGGTEVITKNDSAGLAGRPIRSGFLNKRMVQGLSFWMTSLCIFVAVGASLLAIWEFTGTDVLWRTVATCAVVASGAISFSWVNFLFGEQMT